MIDEKISELFSPFNTDWEGNILKPNQKIVLIKYKAKDGSYTWIKKKTLELVPGPIPDSVALLMSTDSSNHLVMCSLKPLMDTMNPDKFILAIEGVSDDRDRFFLNHFKA